MASPGHLRTAFVCLVFIASFIIFLYTFLTVPPQTIPEVGAFYNQLGLLSNRLGHAEQMNIERRNDLQKLMSTFSEITKLLQNATLESWRNEDIFTNMTKIFAGGNSDQKWNFDLSLPTIQHYLPHTAQHSNSFIPAFKMSKNRSGVEVVLGIPTVKRDQESYLEQTLRSIFENMSEEEKSECLVIVFVAEFDIEYVTSIAEKMRSLYGEHVDQGLLEVISPPQQFYPNMTNLRLTLGDPMDRVQWRSKQNLDYAFLMMYAQWRGVYYVQLEDDILTKSNFVTTMIDFAAEKTSLVNQEKNPDWFVIDFCQLGFIGKMFRSTSLPILIQFTLMFYNDKPVDWLLDHVIDTKSCKLEDRGKKKCKEERALTWIHYKPSLFQHIGKHSSLKGKVQNLKDKEFGDIKLFTPHSNPEAEMASTIEQYEKYSILGAYKGETFYWGKEPTPGDFIFFQLTPPVKISSLKFVSGNIEHPSDLALNTTVELLFEDSNLQELEKFEKLSDNFVIVGTFDLKGFFECKLSVDSKVSQIRLTFHDSSANWVILSEIDVRTST